MNINDFYQRLLQEITASCNIPFQIPISELKRISETSAGWFYRNDEDAVESIYLLIRSEEYLESPLFKANRGFKLPKCVYKVNSVTKSNQFDNKIVSNDSDYRLSSFMYDTFGIGGDSGISGGLGNDAILSYVVYSAWDDLLNHITKHPLSYDYNTLTNRLFLKGDVNDCPDLLLDVYIKLPIEALSESDLYYRHVLGNAYKQLGNMLSVFTMDLPGGASIDYSKWFDYGQTMVDKVEEEVKDNQAMDFFFTTNGL